MPAPLCAHRCAFVAPLVADLARRDGALEVTARISRGLTREYVPLLPTAAPSETSVQAEPIALGPPGEDRAPAVAAATSRCLACGHVYVGAGADTAARECADFDHGTTD